MKQKAVFLDRDGTINVEKNYLYKIEEFEYLNGVKEGLKILQDLGYLLIVITNQSGIARGYYTENDFDKLDRWMVSDLKAAGVTIADSYYCPHHPESGLDAYRKVCNCRKPKLGLFYKAIKKFDIELSASYAIGDKLRDLEICRVSEAKGFLLYCSDEKREKHENIQCICGGILDAAMKIRDKD